MKKALKIGGIIFAVLVVLVGAWTVDNLIYPFKSESPNYSDVEKAFAKLQFPSDWKEISSSENRGLHGRGCSPLNDAGCFHKSKTFTIPDSVNIEDIKVLLVNNSLCPGLVVTDISYKGDVKPTQNFTCQFAAGMTYDGTISGQKHEVYISTSTVN